MALPNTFAIVETTLREGEQFATAHYTSAQKVQIARALDAFGVEYIELTSPVASPRSFRDAQTLVGLGLRAKLLVHVRCTLSDAQAAVATGADGINLFYGTSQFLRSASHRKTLDEIVSEARSVVRYVQDQGREVRFSSEDAFRSDPNDLFPLFKAVDEMGINRIGVADTVGIATPRQVYDLVRHLRSLLQCDIEFHGHNDTGCAIANAYAALEAGATHIDTTVLGIGERNGIAPIGGLIARLYATDPALVAKYNVQQIAQLDHLIADIVGVEIPFNNYLTGSSAFTHKAGVHTNAVLRNPSAYEAIDPAAFGLTRHLEIGHSLTGRAAIADRARTLGLTLDDDDLRTVTAQIKSLSDHRRIEMADIDNLIVSSTHAS